jgi:hypothetical protein
MNRFSCRAACIAFMTISPAALASTQLPPMRPGFWESSTVMHMNVAGQPPDTDNTPDIQYNCEDAASMATELKVMAGSLPGCTFDLEGGGSTYTLTGNCKNPSGMTGTITSTGTITLDGDTAWHMIETSSSDIQNMQTKMDMTGDSKWIGACPSGVVPGDYGTMTNGAFTKQGNSLTNVSP